MRKKIYLVTVCITSIVLFACTTKKEAKEHTQPTKHHEGTKMMPETGKEVETLKEKAEYACPMKCHTSAEPGECPKCGMKMEKIK